jgi:hypothetical protein
MLLPQGTVLASKPIPFPIPRPTLHISQQPTLYTTGWLGCLWSALGCRLDKSRECVLLADFCICSTWKSVWWISRKPETTMTVRKHVFPSHGVKSGGRRPKAKVGIYKNEGPVSFCLAVSSSFHCLTCFFLCLYRLGGAEPSASI